jgi:hypothetical protein
VTSDAALKVARELAFSLGVPLHVVKLIPFDDYRVLFNASADIVETVDPPKMVHPETHGRFQIAASAKP